MIFICNVGVSQDFLWPVEGQRLISGTFGELRSNHFHGGLDIKRSDRSYLPQIRAIEKGFISRLVVDFEGYGQAVYIDHPTGYTSVYAHLDEFSEPIADYIDNIQRERKIQEVDINLNPGELKVRRGEIIGRMGNTGSSIAPHLHFEIRNSRNQTQINPLLFYEVADVRAPEPEMLNVIAFFDKGEPHCIYHKINLNGKTQDLGTIITPAPWTGFAVAAFDQLSGTRNHNGIYAMELEINGSTGFKARLDSIEMGSTRYMNAHIHFEGYLDTRKRSHRFHKLPGDLLNIYELSTDAGLIHLSPNTTKDFSISLKDKSGNETLLNGKLRYMPSSTSEVCYDSSYFTAKWDRSLVLKLDGTTFKLPVGTFYHDQPLKWNYSIDRKCLSQVYELLPDNIAPHNYIDVEMELGDVSPSDNLAIGVMTSSGYLLSAGGELQDGKIAAPIRRMGKFCIIKDESPPRILPFRRTSRNEWKFKVTDDPYYIGRGPDLYFDVKVNGVWEPVYYDAKNETMILKVHERINTIEIEVTDPAGNKSVYQKSY